MDELIIKQRQGKKQALVVGVGFFTFLLIVLLAVLGLGSLKTDKPGYGADSGADYVVIPKTEIPNGAELNQFLRGLDKNSTLHIDGDKIRTITFDYYSSSVEFDDNDNLIDPDNATKQYIKDGKNIIENITPYAITNEIDLYILPNGDFYDLYFLSFKQISSGVNPSTMFFSLRNLEEIDFNNFNTELATEMKSMFSHCPSLNYLDLSCFDTSNVTDMSCMFNSSGLYMLDLSSFDTRKVTTMYAMFGATAIREVNLSSFDTHNCQDMLYFFNDNKHLRVVYASDNLVFNNPDPYLFAYGTTELTGGRGTRVYDTKIYSSEYARIDREGAPGYFTDISEYKDLKTKLPNGETLRDHLLGIYVKDNTPVNSITFDKYSQNNSYFVDGVDITKNSSAEKIAQNITLYRHLENGSYNIYLLSNNTIYANRNMVKAFCPFNETYMDYDSWHGIKISPLYNLKAITFNNFDTSCCKDMSYMFYCDCYVESLDLRCFDTSNVEDMNNMFMHCESLKNVNLTSFNTSKVKSFLQFFGRCKFTSVDMSSFDTSSAEIMNNMFWECFNLVNVDLSNFNTSKVTDMSGMFLWCYALETVDLSNATAENLKTVYYMFDKCNNLKTVYVSKNWNPTKLGAETTFRECYHIQGGAGTKFSSNNITSNYARIDGGETNPGYFSVK